MKTALKIGIIVAAMLIARVMPAQVAVISGQAINQYGQPNPFASVRVCNVTSTGNPCTPTTAIYMDYGLSIPAANPYTTDQYGNYLLYGPALASPNVYEVELNPNPGITWTYGVQGPGCSNSGCTATIFNATVAPYYEVNGVQLASTNLLDTANIAYLNQSNTFTGTVNNFGAVNATSIGATTPGTGVYTALSSASGALNGTLGATTPHTVAATTLTTTGLAALNSATVGGQNVCEQNGTNCPATPTLGGVVTSGNVALGPGAGSGASIVNVAGFDGSHVVSIITGSAPAINNTIFTFTFTQNRGHGAFCTASPYRFGEYSAIAQIPFADVGSSGSATGYLLDIAGTALTAATEYDFNVICP